MTIAIGEYCHSCCHSDLPISHGDGDGDDDAVVGDAIGDGDGDCGGG